LNCFGWKGPCWSSKALENSFNFVELVMNTTHYTEEQKRLPSFGLLALGVSLLAYIFCKADMFEFSAYYIGCLLLLTGSIQIVVGIRSQKKGHPYAAGTLLPLGMFWLSIIGYEIFPMLGYGESPSAMATFLYLSLWALFVAILFLRSFRQSTSMRYLYGTMMVCLMLLSLDQLRNDQVFLLVGCAFGLCSALVAMYMAVHNTLINRGLCSP
jgi:succinate-acetate transporter protein